jgi:hypothetical protein
MFEILMSASMGLGMILGTWALLLLASILFSAVCLLFCSDGSKKKSRVQRVSSLTESVSLCQETGLENWQLVEYAQKLVAREMSRYGYCNSFDFPARAFERGKGYCWQRSGALEAILRELGFTVWMVHAFMNRFRGGFLAGHVWLRVRIGDQVKDVCPGDLANAPGKIHFTSITRVREWGPGIFVFSYLGVPIVNMFAFFVHVVRRHSHTRHR